MKRADLKFINVVDDRWPGSYSTIMYTGELRPYKDGLLYSFNYSTGGGVVVSGTGMVLNEKYSRMSPEEIELTCAVARPATADDVYEACVRGDMTEAYAEMYSGRGPGGGARG
jgi:hypothetical protein